MASSGGLARINVSVWITGFFPRMLFTEMFSSAFSSDFSFMYNYTSLCFPDDIVVIHRNTSAGGRSPPRRIWLDLPSE